MSTHPSVSANSFWTRFTLLMVSTLTVMSGATISPSLPTMREHFNAVPNVDYWVRLALTLPALFIALGAPFSGIIIDRLGRKPLLIISLVLYGLAGGSGFILNRLDWILVGRALLGISVAGIMTTATTLIADYYSGTDRINFLGLQSGFMGLGGVLFLSLGGVLADLNWRFPFLIYLMSLILVPLAWVLLPEPPHSSGKQATNPATSEFQSRVWILVIMTYGIALVTQLVFYLIPVQLPFFLRQLSQANASQSGLALALFTLFSATSSILYRHLKSRLNFLTIYGIAFINMGLGYTIIGRANSYSLVLVGLAIAGCGLGLLLPNMSLCLTSATPEVLRGRVISGMTTFMFLGQFISPLLSQPLSQAVGLGAMYLYAAGLMVVLSGLTGILTWKWH